MFVSAAVSSNLTHTGTDPPHPYLMSRVAQLLHIFVCMSKNIYNFNIIGKWINKLEGNPPIRGKKVIKKSKLTACLNI